MLKRHKSRIIRRNSTTMGWALPFFGTSLRPFPLDLRSTAASFRGSAIHQEGLALK